MNSEPKNITNIYQQRALSYDLEEKLFYLIGFRMNYYREIAINTLQLSPGDTVIDLCCGTGLNFPLLYQAVGPSGKIIGVDLSEAMLKQANKRIMKNSWKNIEIFSKNINEYQCPEEVDGIVTSFAITLIPQYDNVLFQASKALRAGKRLVVLDFKIPPWPTWLTKLAIECFIKPYGGSIEMGSRRPWESVNKHFKETVYKEFYFGSIYVSSGGKK